jgi:GT2 family glycosyltransferase
VYHDQPDNDWFVAGNFKYFWGPDARHEPMPSSRRDAYPIAYAPTCCMIVRDSVFARIGMMDAAYFVYWDDTDFCLRMQRADLRLMCDAGLSMSHKVSSLTGGTMSDFFIRYHHRNQVYYVRKHFGPVVLAYTLLMSILKAAIRVPLRGDTLRQFGLRLRSMGEGLKLPVAGRIGVPGRPCTD